MLNILVNQIIDGDGNRERERERRLMIHNLYNLYNDAFAVFKYDRMCNYLKHLYITSVYERNLKVFFYFGRLSAKLL